MAFNIKNEETIQIAREIAAETGKSIATVFDVSIREWQERRPQRADLRRRRIQRIVAETSEILREQPLPDHGDLLYDDRGMPA